VWLWADENKRKGRAEVTCRMIGKAVTAQLQGWNELRKENPCKQETLVNEAKWSRRREAKRLILTIWGTHSCQGIL
jgi:hypothetical protein